MADIEQEIKEFEKEIYPELVAKWREVCKIRKNPNIILYAMELIRAFNKGKSVEAVQTIFEKQIYSGQAGKQTLSLVAEFTPGQDCKGIELFCAAEPEYVKQKSVAKKLETYRAQIKACDNKLNYIKDYRSKVSSDRLVMFDRFVAEAENGSSVVEHLYKAVQILNSIKDSSAKKIKLEDSEHDLATGIVVAQIGGRGMLGVMVAKGMMSEKLSQQVMQYVEQEQSEKRIGSVKKSAKEMVDRVSAGNKKLESAAKNMYETSKRKVTKQKLGALGKKVGEFVLQPETSEKSKK